MKESITSSVHRYLLSKGEMQKMSKLCQELNLRTNRHGNKGIVVDFTKGEGGLELKFISAAEKAGIKIEK